MEESIKISSKNNVVAMWPKKKKTFVRGYLAEELKKSFQNTVVTAEGKYFSDIKNKLLRRVFYTIQGKPGFPRVLPIAYYEYTDKFGNYSSKRLRHFYDGEKTNLLVGYRKIVRELKKEGFIAKAFIEKYRDNTYDTRSGWRWNYKTKIEISGWTE